MLEGIAEDAGYLERIFFFDECKFSLSGRLNGKNCRMWDTQRMIDTYTEQQQRQFVMA